MSEEIQKEEGKEVKNEIQNQNQNQNETEQLKSEVERLKAELLQTKVVATLSSMGLEEFVDFFDVNDEKEIDEKIKKLKDALEKHKVKNRYIPADHRPSEEKGDVLSRISGKLGRLFG